MRSFATCLLGAACAIAIAQVDLTKPVLTVNGESVAGAEYYRRMETLQGVGQMLQSGFTEAAPGFLTLQRLIEERLMIQLAKQKGIAPSEQEVADEVALRKRQNPDMLQGLARMGLSEADLTYQVRLELSQFMLQTQGINITDQEVAKFYKDNPSYFTSSKGYKLRVVAVQTDAEKAAVDADLKAGKPFTEIARSRSKDPSRMNDGLLGVLPIDSLSDVSKQAIAAVKVGQATDWIKGNTSSVRFFVEEEVPEKKRALDADLRREVRRKLMIDRGRVKNDLAVMMREFRSKAIVEVKQTAFGSAIKGYLEAARAGG